MKKFFLCLLLLFALPLSVQAETLRSQISIPIEAGKVSETGILSDAGGNVFLEFLTNTRVVRNQDKISFVGEILPPSIIALPGDAPRARMKEMFTFELLADTAEKLTFADKFDLMSEMSRLRSRLLTPNSFQRNGTLVSVLIPIKEPVGQLALWEYLNDEEGWLRIGGKLEETEDPDVQVFSSMLRGTGVFTLFDENPGPEFVPPFPLDQIQMAEPDPFAPAAEAAPIPIENEVTPPAEENLFPSAPPGLNVIEPVQVEGMESLPDQEIGVNLPPFLQTDLASPGENAMPEQIPPSLPQSGPEGDEPSEKSFPLMLIFAFLILGGSAYLAFFTHDPAQKI